MLSHTSSKDKDKEQEKESEDDSEKARATCHRFNGGVFLGFMLEKHQ